MTDHPLFDRSQRRRPAAHATDTRSQAAESARPILAELQRRVLAFIVGRGEHGATDEQIAIGLKMKPDTSRARRVELRDKGLVLDSGRQRATQSGRAAVVWVAISQEMATANPASTTHVASKLDWHQLYPCADYWHRER
jgi:hypothetical protein